MTNQNRNRIFVLGLTLVLVFGVTMLGIAFVMPSSNMVHDGEMFSAEYNKEVGSEVEVGIKNLIASGRYKCCLENPCSYCFTDKEHQDRELVCDCLVDIMNGEAPCGECTGEILEGEGNALIAEYFATSIADEVGEQHLDTLQQIIAEKYDIPVTEQL